MEITVNINSPELSSAINRLAEAIERSVSAPKAEPPKAEPPKAEPPKAEPPKTEPPKAEPPKAEPPKAEPPKAEPPKTEPPKAEPPKAEATFTLIQVREKLAELSRSGKQAQVKALIEKFGASKLSDVKEKDYAALMAEAEGL